MASSKKRTPLSLTTTPYYENDENDDDNNDDTLHQSQEDTCLSTSSHLTHQQLLRRRLSRTHRLSKIYRHHYWALMDHLRAQYRHYYWTYGISPVFSTASPDTIDFEPEGCGETNNNNQCNVAGGKLGLGFGECNNNNGTSNGGGGSIINGNHRCAYSACKLKAMAMTSFCHLHILSDPQQKLYKPCTFVVKAPQQGQILCGKPILRSAVPSLCNIHLPKSLKDVKHALKKAGLTASSSARLAPKFHVVLAEYVQLIQSKRRVIQKRGKKKFVIKKESSS